MYDHNHFSEPSHEGKANVTQTAQRVKRQGRTQIFPKQPSKVSIPEARWDPNRTQQLKSCIKPDPYPVLL